MIGRVHPTFATRAFVAQALRGYEDLGLLPRARHVARALARAVAPQSERNDLVCVANGTRHHPELRHVSAPRQCPSAGQWVDRNSC
jgi:hypothetical protein